MSTIIGFILPKYFKNLDSCDLPMGFSEEGECVDFDLRDCKLIYLDDEDNYTNGNTQQSMQLNNDDSKKALLFQHDSNSSKWDDQINWLKKHNWDPKRIDSFSHNKGTFIDITRDLLKLLRNGDDPCQAQKRKEIIDRLVSKYTNRYLFKMLDEYVTWEILYFMNGNVPNSLEFKERREIYRDLPENLREPLSPEKNATIETLTATISTANKQAFDLLQ